MPGHTTLTWATVYAVFTVTGVGAGYALAQHHNHNASGAAVLASISNANGGNTAGVGKGHEPFTVTSTAVTGLVPGGPARVLPLTLTNTDNSAYRVLNLQIDVSSPAGCVAANNLVIAGMGRTQLLGAANAYSSTAAGAPQYVIPKNGSLAVDGVTIRMLDQAGKDQDMCKSQTFGLTYAATATEGN